MNRGLWRGIFISCILMLLVLIISLYQEPDSATFIIIQLAALHVIAAMVIIGSMLYFDWDPFRAFR